MRIVIDRDLDVVPWLSPVCTFCRHARGSRRCAAFDGEIPIAIWVGLNQHRQAHDGDHGIQFEPVPGASVTTPLDPDWSAIRLLRAEGRLPAQEPVKA